MKLTVLPVLDVAGNVIAVGALGGVEQGFAPVPVAVNVSAHPGLVPEIVIVEDSVPTVVGVYCTYTFAESVAVFEKLYVVAHEPARPVGDTWKSGLEELTVTVPAVRPLPVTV